MSKKILNRPMFAKMKDGGLQKILYAYTGTTVTKTPYRPAELNKQQYGRFFDFLNPFGGDYNIIGKNKEGKFYSQAIEDLTGADAARKEIKEKDPNRKVGLFEYLPFYSGLGDFNFKPEVVAPGESKEQLPSRPNTVSPGAGNTRREDPPKKKKGETLDETLDLKEKIKSGSLDESIKEKIDIFQKYLGKDKKKKQKNAVFQMMVETGLGMVADKGGGNILEIAARNAKDPVKKLNEVGNEILDRAEKINEAGVEAGLSSYEKEKDRNLEEANQLIDIRIQELKNEATKKTQSEFITDAVANILADENARNSFTMGAYDANGERIEGAGTDVEIITGQIRDVWGSANATSIPAGEGGQAVFDSLPSGTWYFDEETGRTVKKE